MSDEDYTLDSKLPFAKQGDAEGDLFDNDVGLPQIEKKVMKERLIQGYENTVFTQVNRFERVGLLAKLADAGVPLEEGIFQEDDSLNLCWGRAGRCVRRAHLAYAINDGRNWVSPEKFYRLCTEQATSLYTDLAELRNKLHDVQTDLDAALQELAEMRSPGRLSTGARHGATDDIPF